MVKLKDIFTNPANPRIIRDDKYKKLVKSIDEFPKMMELRPIIVDSEGMILGGNMRYKALKELGYKEVPETWIKRANDLTEDEIRRFTIADNVGFGEWDYELLANEWDMQELEDWGVDLPGFGNLQMLNQVNKGDENDAWVGMPEFEEDEKSLRLIIQFESEQEREDFCKEKNIEIRRKSILVWSTIYPFRKMDDETSLKYD